MFFFVSNTTMFRSLEIGEAVLYLGESWERKWGGGNCVSSREPGEECV